MSDLGKDHCSSKCKRANKAVVLTERGRPFFGGHRNPMCGSVRKPGEPGDHPHVSLISLCSSPTGLYLRPTTPSSWRWDPEWILHLHGCQPLVADGYPNNTTQDLASLLRVASLKMDFYSICREIDERLLVRQSPLLKALDQVSLV